MSLASEDLFLPEFEPVMLYPLLGSLTTEQRTCPNVKMQNQLLTLVLKQL